MQGWLEREIADIHKAAELRIKDAERFVNAYARGELSPEEAEKRGYEYSERWGDSPLPGVFRSQGLSDDEILRLIDQARGSNFVDRVTQTSRSSGRKKGG
jgi:hypothetical protein